MDLWTNELVDKWTNEPKVKRLELIRNLDDPEAGLFLGVCVKKITDKEMSEQPLLKKFEPASYRPFRPKFGLRAVTALSRNLGGSGSAGVHAQTGTFFPAKNVLHLLRGFFSRNARVVGFCCLCSAPSLASRASEEVLQKL